MEWQNEHTHAMKVFSSYLVLPNGWTATVVDDSLMRAPFRGVKYRVSANCRWWGVGYPETFDFLEDARSAALLYAMQMPPVDPNALDGLHCAGAWQIRDQVVARWREQKA